MWTRTFRGLTGDIALEVSDGASVAAQVAATVFDCWGPPRDRAPSLRYRLQCDSLEVVRDDVVIATVEHEVDLVPVFELDLYHQLIAGATAHWVVHGAGLVLDGQALVLSGPSGAGKSTMTLGMLGRGATYLSDEYVAIGTDGVCGISRALAFDTAPVAAVPAALQRVDYPLRVGGALVNQPVYRPAAAVCAAAPAPLGALVVLRHAPLDSPGLHAISSAFALQRLWEQTMNRSDSALAQATRAIEHCPVYELVTRDVEGGCRALEELLPWGT
jgi:hypothetical protein